MYACTHPPVVPAALPELGVDRHGLFVRWLLVWQGLKADARAFSAVMSGYANLGRW